MVLCVSNNGLLFIIIIIIIIMDVSNFNLEH